MERLRCKLCSRTFANGRALGGHMKSHLAPLPIPPPPPPAKPLHRCLTAADSVSFSSASPSPASSSPDSAHEENSDGKASILKWTRENPRRRSLKFPDPELPSKNAEESAAETIAPRRPKLARRRSCAEEDEDSVIAMCLVMLSRDKWTTAAAKSDMKRHRCEVCNKAFRSSQALGGHRVTHRKALCAKGEAKKRGRSRPLDHDVEAEPESVFECPYCFKVFGSGQALGGHKRSHLIGSGNGPPAVSYSVKAGNHHPEKNSFIDLNLPAPPEEDDDQSVVSFGEIAEPAGRT
ncbi:hypothetical protein SAY87_030229 [Trapa incisa]|uniref:C2H2-type domain-containing protein n=1 Tax=Trapa incisa TaxID=236973 RepID=A0AAN7QJE5_9MYRT|nr:hypothetical protein SAY87_030229 [Trapa incisa]